MAWVVTDSFTALTAVILPLEDVWWHVLNTGMAPYVMLTQELVTSSVIICNLKKRN